MSHAFLYQYRQRHVASRTWNHLREFMHVAAMNMLKLKLSHYTPRRRLGGEKYSPYSFSTSVLDGVSGHRHSPAALYPRRKAPGTHCTGGWVGPRAGLDTEATRKILSLLPGIQPRSPGRPARSQTLYCLSYPDHSNEYSVR
jgi:hypothetical protein